MRMTSLSANPSAAQLTRACVFRSAANVSSKIWSSPKKWPKMTTTASPEHANFLCTQEVAVWCLLPTISLFSASFLVLTNKDGHLVKVFMISPHYYSLLFSLRFEMLKASIGAHFAPNSSLWPFKWREWLKTDDGTKKMTIHSSFHP